ncbi:MAG: saccharopine dehydrogenase C-terminal domain-containing protein [Halieaceae bacterium]|nr:saccharopine dehydrogenase C-terminal domain-containing protein [Halieaceae bacterium]
MTQIALIGSGKVGATICELLLATGDYDITLLDSAEAQLGRVPDNPRLSKQCLQVADAGVLSEALVGQFAVLSAGPFHITPVVAEAAKAAGVHYLDLTEDIASTRRVWELAEAADSAFIPQCGLAPGFISIVANWLCEKFDTLDTVRMRVGALPRYPTNSLLYNMTWSTEGLINEYCEQCEAIMDGNKITLPALTQRKYFSLDGTRYESFNTSGGQGSLADTLAGRVNNLSYQTIRYPGHLDIMRTLLLDLKLSERRDLLKDIMEYALPTTFQDVVLIFATVSGMRDGQLQQETYVNKVYGQAEEGAQRSAIQLTTAGAICAMLDLLVEGKLPERGLVRQEQVALEDFLANRFGRIFTPESERQYSVTEE